MAVMMFYKNTKAVVHSLDCGADFFDIIVGFLQEDTLVPYLFIICLDYVVQPSIYLKKKKKENGFTLKKTKR